jgi:intein/homing endonuclease
MWHRVIQSSQDATGISLKTLQEGDNVLTCIDGKYEIATIVKRVVERGNFIVKSIRLPKPHLFITNGFVSHNAKPLEDF